MSKPLNPMTQEKLDGEGNYGVSRRCPGEHRTGQSNKEEVIIQHESLFISYFRKGIRSRFSNGLTRVFLAKHLLSEQELGVALTPPLRCFGFWYRHGMEACEGQQGVLRDLNKRLSSFLEHAAELQETNRGLQEQIATWRTPLERDWSSQGYRHGMEACEGQQGVLRDLNKRLSIFLEHAAELQETNRGLQEQIATWRTPLERDWSSQERTVEELRAQVGAPVTVCATLCCHLLVCKKTSPEILDTTYWSSSDTCTHKSGPRLQARGIHQAQDGHAPSARSQTSTEVRKRWHSLQVEVESLHAVERSLQSSLKHTQHRYSLQLQDLSRSVCELEAELDGVREGLAAQKQHHHQLLNTKMRLEREIATYRRLLEHEEGRYFSVDGPPRKLKPWKLANPIVSRDGEISTVKTQEIVEGKVVRESAEGHGRVETEKIDKVIKQWEGSFFQGNPKLRKKSVSLRFDLHMAVSDEGCAQTKQDSLPDVEVRLVMKRSRSIPSITP
ncbi:keratin-like protein KRT222 [Silurus meridionalis]|nr:keratin-like protein KRT222 [Silurus meridionalis]